MQYPQIIQQLDNFVSRLCRLLAGIAILLIVYIFLHVIIEIFLRSFFSSSTFILEEFVGYALISVIFLGLPYVQQNNGNIRVETIDYFIKKKLYKKILTLFRMLILIFIYILAIFCFFDIFLENINFKFTSTSFAEVPLWVSQIPIILGLFVGTLRAIVDSLISLSFFNSKDKVGG